MKPRLDADFFQQETLLDPEISFNQPLSAHIDNPQAIFLTGATGLLGAYLLRDLLAQTQAVVYCLIRAKNTPEASARLKQHLESYQLYSEENAPRIIPIVGDLSLPHFGLGDEQYQHLATECDAIYHSAGWINLLFPYKKLKPINVSGVQEALRLASLEKTKAFHFISSIAVFYSDAHPASERLLETTEPLFHPSLKADYGKSKWVADRLVANAQQLGLPACIYRPVRIMGDSQTGILNDNSELLPRLLKGCVKMGLYPDWDIEITLVPADYLSRAIVEIAGQRESWNKDFHFFNPQPIAWHDLIDVFHELGYDMKKVSPDEWSQQLRHHATHEDEHDVKGRQFFAALMVAFTGLHYLFHPRPEFDDANIQAALKDTEISCPPVDATLIQHYVSYWQQDGFLPKPQSTEA